MSRSSSFASYASDDDSSVPLSEQAEWKDIVPIDQDDGVHPICPIAYTADYKELMGYFRAIMSTGEISPRAYRLTSRVIQENPAHYTVWVYRKKLLEELQISVESELDWLEGVAQQYPKNYQPWHHRQMLLTMLLDPAVFAGMSEDQRVCHPAIRRELRFLANAIDVESKNFHAWSYRQWLVRRYGIWDQERVFLTTMIDQDVRNNSAWNQRYFVLVRGAEDPQNVELLDQAALIEEIEFALEMARRAPNNE
ncbi:CAAX geranylgeranyltransferase alpha subunit, partial [Kickxella alabastrina]